MKRLTVVAALLASFPFVAAAQETALTAGDVRSFLAGASKQVENAVAQKDWEGMYNWMSEHIADDAHISMVGTAAAPGGSTFNMALTMSGEDYKKAGRAMMTMMPKQLESGNLAVEGYRLDTTMDSVTELPTGAYAARVTFVEAGQIGDHTFFSTANCLMRFAGKPEDVKIRAATCQVASLF